jgi:hypothetical protein
MRHYGIIIAARIISPFPALFRSTSVYQRETNALLIQREQNFHGILAAGTELSPK